MTGDDPLRRLHQRAVDLGWPPKIRFPRQYLRVIALSFVTVICLVYLLFPSPWYGVDDQPLAHGPQSLGDHPSAQVGSATNSTHSPTTTQSPHTSGQQDGGQCALRFGSGYLDGLVTTATSYCDADSTAHLTCFHHKAQDQNTDSFCLGGPASFEVGAIKLDCVLRHWNESDAASGAPQLDRFRPYWYDTGPRTIFSKYIKLNRFSEATSTPQSNISGFSFLIKRENNNENFWHAMMEIMSLTMSLDVLRKAVDPATRKPFFTDADVADSQVVFLDDLTDGPFYDLWKISARKPSIRLAAMPHAGIDRAKVVVPLPGGSNPFWQGDWVDLDCEQSVLLKTFSNRVLEFYSVPDGPVRSKKPPTLTWIDRKRKRRLLDQKAYFTELEAKYPKIKMQIVDYAAFPLSEQIRLSHSTEILVGVHGAGLTHGMFLPANSTIVEILPPDLKHKGFKNMAKFLGHRHFSRHGSPHESPDNTGDWQHDDVYLEKGEFMDLMEEAIASSID